MYYAYDANYLDYFGSSGSAAIDQAFNILNNSLTNVDGYSTALTEFPLNSEVVNYQARSLNLVDIKSQTMSLMMEQWVWPIPSGMSGACIIVFNPPSLPVRIRPPIRWS